MLENLVGLKNLGSIAESMMILKNPNLKAFGG